MWLSHFGKKLRFNVLPAELISPLPYIGHSEIRQEKNTSILSIIISVSLIYAPAGTAALLWSWSHPHYQLPYIFLLFSPAQYSYHTRSLSLSLAENSLGNRSENCRLPLVTKSCLASVKAEHCDVQNMTSVCLAVSLREIDASATQARLWGKCVLPWAVSVSAPCFTWLGYAELSA